MPGDLHVRIVDSPRPALRHEVRTERPGRHHVWQGGYWHHTGSEWNWNDARYQKVHGGTRYIPGHWSTERVIYN